MENIQAQQMALLRRQEDDRLIKDILYNPVIEMMLGSYFISMGMRERKNEHEHENILDTIRRILTGTTSKDTMAGLMYSGLFGLIMAQQLAPIAAQVPEITGKLLDIGNIIK